jgi:hypothetical protein
MKVCIPAFQEIGKGTPCHICPNQPPEVYPGNALFLKLYDLADAFRDTSGAISLTGFVSILQAEGLTGEEFLLMIRKAKVAEALHRERMRKVTKNV